LGYTTKRIVQSFVTVGFAYSALLNAIIAILFKLEKGMYLIGKDPKTGEIPLWSYVVFFPFHLPTLAYTYVHTKKGKQDVELDDGTIVKQHVPVASEVQKGVSLRQLFFIR
jgi:hypothetical protein